MILPKVWREAERRWPNKIALISETDEITYGDLAVRIRSLSGGLTGQWGVKPGDVVALLAPNCAEFVVSYFAVTSVAAVVQPIDERLSTEEVSYMLRDSAARFVIVHQSYWSKIAGLQDEIRSIERVLLIGDGEDSIESFKSWMKLPPCSISADKDPAACDIAELMYTSGTSGDPKGVNRSHANALAASSNARRAFGYKNNDVISIAMPLTHSSALVSQMLPMIEVGGTAVLVSQFDAAKFLETIREQAVSCFRAVPAMFQMLLIYRQFDGEYLPSLRLLMNSSAAIDPATFKEIKNRFPDVEIVNSYGLTEASTCTILTDKMALQHPDSIGVPISGVEMVIVDETGNFLADGVEGEIWIRGMNVFSGYHNRITETAAAFAPGGWLKTGDLGYQDTDGLFYFRGRKDELINCGGRKYAPIEVQDCILRLPEIRDAAVTAMPHRILGQVAKAIVVFNDDEVPDLKAVTRHCAKYLPSHKVPFHVEAVDALPRNNLGKVLHRALRVETNPSAAEDKLTDGVHQHVTD